MRLVLVPIATLVIAATAAPAQAPTAGGSEELVEKFIAVLPDSRRLHLIDRTPNPALLEPFSRLNPGREEEIRTVLSDAQACISEARNAATLDFLRNVARSLGDEKLRRVIAFYTGPDLARIELLLRRSGRREALSPEEAAELERLKLHYALDDYHAAFNLRLPDLADVPRASECSRSAFARLERSGIRVRRDSPATPR